MCIYVYMCIYIYIYMNMYTFDRVWLLLLLEALDAVLCQRDEAGVGLQVLADDLPYIYI